MLSFDVCRSILSAETAISDADLQHLLEELYAIARIVTKTRGGRVMTANFNEEIGAMSETERQDTIERAAILEFDARLPRLNAEQQALRMSARQDVRTRKHVR